MLRVFWNYKLTIFQVKMKVQNFTIISLLQILTLLLRIMDENLETIPNDYFLLRTIEEYKISSENTPLLY